MTIIMPNTISQAAGDTSTTAVVVPPINFSLVAPGIYRSGHPNKKNLSFLRRLKLKSVMYLEGTDEYRKDSREFVEREGIELFRFDLVKEDVSLCVCGGLKDTIVIHRVGCGGGDEQIGARAHGERAGSGGGEQRWSG